MNPEKIGKYILGLRTKANLSQNDLAKMIPISRQAISKWERGETIPDSSTLVVLSELFNVSINSLLAGETVDNFDEKKASSFALNMVDEHNLKVKKIKKLKIIILGILVSFINIFLLYYFFNTYNSVRVYSVVAEKEDVFTDNGLLILTKDNIYFKLGDINSSKEVKRVELYYKDKNKRELIYSSDDQNILIRDYNGYNSYFKFKIFDNSIDNILLIVYYDDNFEELELKFIKDFSNNNFIFTKKEPISNNKEYIYVDTISLLRKIDEKFLCYDDICTLEANENINFVYFRNNELLNIVEIKNGETKEWNYYIKNGVVDFKLYLDNELKENKSIEFKKNIENNEHINLYLDFYNNYLEKYIYH